MCAKFGSPSRVPPPPLPSTKNLHVRNARHTWLKVETTPPPLLPSPLTNIPSADVRSRALPYLRKDLFQVAGDGADPSALSDRIFRTKTFGRQVGRGERSRLRPMNLLHRNSLIALVLLGHRMGSINTGTPYKKDEYR